MQPIRNSRQRSAIQAELAVRKDHPTAEALYRKLKESWPGLSLGTVYRNLAQLCAAGVARKITCDGADHFDGDTRSHCHITCQCCGSVHDLDFPSPVQLEDIERQTAGRYDGKITGCDLLFTGLCPHCLNTPRGG